MAPILSPFPPVPSLPRFPLCRKLNSYAMTRAETLSACLRPVMSTQLLRAALQPWAPTHFSEKIRGITLCAEGEGGSDRAAQPACARAGRKIQAASSLPGASPRVDGPACLRPRLPETRPASGDVRACGDADARARAVLVSGVGARARVWADVRALEGICKHRPAFWPRCLSQRLGFLPGYFSHSGGGRRNGMRRVTGAGASRETGREPEMMAVPAVPQQLAS